MKTTKTLYWIFNGLFALAMFGSGIPNLLSMDMSVHGIHNLMGYPLYFIPFIGLAKIAGAIVILVPGYPRLKEWAYAGLTFDLIAAAYSLYHTPNPEGPWWSMLIFLALDAAAYIYYHKKVKITTTEKVPN